MNNKLIDIVNINFVPYTRYDNISNGLWWYKLNYCDDTEQGTYLLKFDPGISTQEHYHEDFEEFYIISGELSDTSNKITKIYKQNQYIIYQPKTIHQSFSKNGCLILVVSKGKNILSKL